LGAKGLSGKKERVKKTWKLGSDGKRNGESSGKAKGERTSSSKKRQGGVKKDSSRVS